MLTQYQVSPGNFKDNGLVEAPNSPLSSPFWLYGWLSHVPFLKGYVAKVMAVGFLGVHVPLLVLIGYFVISTGGHFDKAQWHVLELALLATVLGTCCTLYANYELLAPVLRTSQALGDF